MTHRADAFKRKASELKRRIEDPLEEEITSIEYDRGEMLDFCYMILDTDSDVLDTFIEEVTIAEEEDTSID